MLNNEGLNIKAVQSPSTLVGRGGHPLATQRDREPQSVLGSGLLMAEKDQFPAANL